VRALPPAGVAAVRGQAGSWSTAGKCERPGRHTIVVDSPLVRTQATFLIEMEDDRRFLFHDEFALSFHMHFYRLLKWVLVLPLLAMAFAIVARSPGDRRPEPALLCCPGASGVALASRPGPHIFVLCYYTVNYTAELSDVWYTVLSSSLCTGHVSVDAKIAFTSEKIVWYSLVHVSWF